MPPRIVPTATALLLGGGALVGGFAAMATLPSKPDRAETPRSSLVRDATPERSSFAHLDIAPPPSTAGTDVSVPELGPAEAPQAAVEEPDVDERSRAGHAPRPDPATARPAPPTPAEPSAGADAASSCDDPKPVHCAHGPRHGHETGHERNHETGDAGETDHRSNAGGRGGAG